MKNLLRICSSILALGIYTITFGAGTVEKFDIQATPTKVKVGESVDIVIKALDKDGNIVKDYAGEILVFSQSDPKAEFPGILTENTYKFKASDSGQVKFENAIKFTKAGTQDINVYDTAKEDVFGLVEVEVSTGSVSTSTAEIKINSPEDGITVGSDKVKVSGTTLKNHKVKIILNAGTGTEVTSNSDGIFEMQLSGLPSGENSILANVLDSDGKVIGESQKVLFKIDSSLPKFNGIKVNPEGEVAGETVLNIEVDATSGLTDVSITLNDLIQQLQEKSPGIYTGTITAPKDNGDYKINLSLRSELGVESKENGVASITVKNVELTSAPEVLTGVNCDDLKKELIVKNIKLVKMKTKSSLSWDIVPKATSYNLYKKDKTGSGMVLIQNTTDTQVEINIVGNALSYDDFSVKAVLKNESCEIESKDFPSMTKVQTGPKELILIILSLMLVGGLFFMRRKNA
ncbi:MAG: hypothetical protein PHE25_01335 [Candidatus Gracilibacteria bacterium]|nr:hypothetical protein [Candidatus Gracilibacteria bacterium]